MTKDFAWFLGWLFTDGHIPRKGSSGYITGLLSFNCQYLDTEVLYKIKNILDSSANVREYPNYKSPQSQLRIYNKDLS